MAKIKFDSNGEGDRETLGRGNTNTWNGSKLELASSKKSSSYSENNFPILLLSGILNKSIYKVLDVLHSVNF